MLHIDKKKGTQKIAITELKDNIMGLLGSGIVFYILFLITNKYY